MLTLLVPLALVAAGCTSPTPTPAEAPSPAGEAGYNLGGREIRIGVENAYPPFNFIDEETGKPMGWDYDACRAICEVIGCTPVFVETTREGILEATAAGEYDLVADGVIITPEREEIVDFSIPYMVIAQYIVVRIDETGIVDEASLIASDAIVGTQIGTTNEAKAIELVGADRVRSFDTFDLPVQALISGDVDAVLMDLETAQGFVDQNPDKIKILPEPVTGAEELGFAFPPGSDLIEPVNYAIRVLQENGTLEKLHQKWWGR